MTKKEAYEKLLNHIEGLEYEAVSYTHLDVYKRQAYSNATNKGCSIRI